MSLHDTPTPTPSAGSTLHDGSHLDLSAMPQNKPPQEVEEDFTDRLHPADIAAAILDQPIQQALQPNDHDPNLSTPGFDNKKEPVETPPANPESQHNDEHSAELGEASALPNTTIARTKTGNSSTQPYSAFPLRTKWLIVSLGGLAAVFSPISSNIFVPAIPALAVDFHTTEEKISLAVTVYLVFQAVTPSFFGSLSDTYGRRPVYIATLVVYIGANIGLALCPTNAYWLLLVLRALQATGGSAVISVGAGAVSDVAEPRERGTFMSVFQCGAMIGPAFGPLLGGVFAQTLGWRAIFWFLTIATSVVLVPLIFLMPETLRSLVGDGSIPPPRLNSSPQQLYQRHQREKRGEVHVHVERPPRKPYQPLSAFLILFTPEIFLIFVFVSLQYLEFYSLLTVYSTALKTSYGLSELQIGLCYLPSGIGIIISALVNGRWIDWCYRREERRMGGDYRKIGEEFRIEKVRFMVPIPSLICFVSACIALGWCLEVRAPLAATLVINFFVGLGSGAVNLATVYGQDLKPGKGGAVSASLNLIRCIFGAIGSAVIIIIYKAINPGWTFVLLSGLVLIALPIPIWVCRDARKWRARRQERAARKAERKKEKH